MIKVSISSSSVSFSKKEEKKERQTLVHLIPRLTLQQVYQLYQISTLYIHDENRNNDNVLYLPYNLVNLFQKRSWWEVRNLFGLLDWLGIEFRIHWLENPDEVLNFLAVMDSREGMSV